MLLPWLSSSKIGDDVERHAEEPERAFRKQCVLVRPTVRAVRHDDDSVFRLIEDDGALVNDAAVITESGVNGRLRRLSRNPYACMQATFP